MTELLSTRSQRTAPTLGISVAGTRFAYRELGPRTEIPLVVLTHLGANLDSWDPRLLDGLAEERGVIALDYRGVGNSTGKVRDSIEDMAEDMAAVIRALGYDRIDLFGLSMGGMVGQAMAAQAPGLIDRLILAGAGPAGGPGLTAMTRIFMMAALRAAITLQDPRTLLFFTRTPAGKKAAREYLARLKERTTGRDRSVTPRVYRAQLAAVRRWGLQQPAGRSQFAGPVLIFHGDSDLMVPPANATALTGQLPAAALTLFPDSGHGAAFQHHSAFIDAARVFLRR